MSEFQSFGTPDRFEISLRWRSDFEKRSRRPADYGWSVGDLRIIVAGQNLTKNFRGVASQSFASWYLFPIAEWLAENWIILLHQEEFSWRERSAAPAALATNRRLDKLIDSRDAFSRGEYAEAQAWRKAHAIRSAANGGVIPDLFFRRYLDNIELSWTAADPPFAPEGLRFVAEPGVAYLPVQDVAVPLWNALHWVVSAGVERLSDERDAASLERLELRLQSIERATVLDLASARIGRDLARAAKSAFEAGGIGEMFFAECAPGAPAAALFSPAVAMFGGLAPNLTSNDVAAVTNVVMSAAASATEGDALLEFVNDCGGAPLRSPFLEGQDLAAAFFDLGTIDRFVQDFVDIEGFLIDFGVSIQRISLDTHEIRGIALAGSGLRSTIVINSSSIYNEGHQGERFTLAHELAHLLHDRSLAISVGMASGPWAPRGVEKRANAFAAMFLMPRFLVLRAFGSANSFNQPSDVNAAAEQLRVSFSALVEHLANLELITDYDRDLLRRRVERQNISH